jgi:hypothetical protein
MMDDVAERGKGWAGSPAFPLNVENGGLRLILTTLSVQIRLPRTYLVHKVGIDMLM